MELVNLLDLDKGMRTYVSPNWTSRIPQYLMETKKVYSEALQSDQKNAARFSVGLAKILIRIKREHHEYHHHYF